MRPPASATTAIRLAIDYDIADEHTAALLGAIAMTSRVPGYALHQYERELDQIFEEVRQPVSRFQMEKITGSSPQQISVPSKTLERAIQLLSLAIPRLPEWDTCTLNSTICWLFLRIGDVPNAVKCYQASLMIPPQAASATALWDAFARGLSHAICAARFPPATVNPQQLIDFFAATAQYPQNFAEQFPLRELSPIFQVIASAGLSIFQVVGTNIVRMLAVGKGLDAETQVPIGEGAAEKLAATVDESTEGAWAFAPFVSALRAIWLERAARGTY